MVRRSVRVAVVGGMLMGMAVFLAAAPAGGPAAASGEPSPEAMDVLNTLEARKATLKDFTAKVELRTDHLAGDTESKLGDAEFVNDAPGDPRFAAHFTKATAGGKALPSPDEQVIFDGAKLALVDNKAKTFRLTTMTTPGGVPGGVTSVGGPMPLPIGLKPADVVRDFVVTMGEAPDAEHVVLKLVPRAAVKSKFDYKSMTLTVDKKLELPVKVELNQKSSDVTTISLTDVQVNSGAAKIPPVTPPTGSGWTIQK